MTYTPETIDVKMAYVTSYDVGGVHKLLAHMVAEMTTGHAADFDRWLRQVRAQAWQEGYITRAFTPLGPGGVPVEDPANPYRLDAATEDPK